MAFNFSAIIAAETKRQEEAEKNGSGNGGGTGFKTVYPFSNGRLEFKFIGNEPSGMLYRELAFHEYFADNKKQKIPCLHEMYGMECPICNNVKYIADTTGMNEVFSKYGIKRQGIMFAKLLSFSPDNYFGDNKNPPKVGDIVTFMFPKSVINEISNLIVEFGDECDSLFTNNETRNVTLKVGTQANGFPEYTFYVKNNTSVLCVDENGNPDEAAFNEFMAKMPNLKDVKFPSSPTEDMTKIHRTLIEEMNNKYLGGASAASDAFKNAAPMGSSVPTSTPTSVANPAPAVNVPPVSTSTPVPPASTEVQAPVNPTPVSTPPVNNNVASEDPRGPRPACYGDNRYDEQCANCPWDAECV